jgi:hypothetical protein
MPPRSTKADVEDQATLDHLDDRALDDAVGLLDRLDRAPGTLVLRPLLREDQTAVLVLLLQHERLELVVERDDLVRIHVVADRELARRDDALRLEADVEQHLVAVDLDHAAGDDVAVVELDDGRVHGVRERHATEVVEDDDAAVDVFVLEPVRVIRADGGVVGDFRGDCCGVLGACFRGRRDRRIPTAVGCGSDLRFRHVLL